MSKNFGLKNYMDKKLRSYAYEGALDRESYLNTTGSGARESYVQAVKDAYTKAKKSEPTWGTKAEALFSSGLSGSGYASRLKSLADEIKESDLKRAEGRYQSSEDSLTRSYLKYLEDYSKSQDELMHTVTRGIIERGLINEEDALFYAKSAGLSDKRAREVSDRGRAAVKNSLITKAIEDTALYGLNKDTARLYAKSLGLDDGVAEYVSGFADVIVSSKKEDSESYYEYIKKLEELSKDLTSKD